MIASVWSVLLVFVEDVLRLMGWMVLGLVGGLAVAHVLGVF